MLDTAYYSLQFAALIFFNVLCISAIVAVFLIIGTFKAIKDKVEETSDKIQETLGNVADTSFNVSQVISSFINPKPKNIWDKIRKLF